MLGKKIELQRSHTVSEACSRFARARVESKILRLIKRTIVAPLWVMIGVLAGVAPAFAVAPPITDFALFGNTNVVVAGTLGTPAMLVGPLGSNDEMNLGTLNNTTKISGGGMLTAGGSSNFMGDIVFNGDAIIAALSVVTGNIDAGGRIEFGAGGLSTINGNITAGGDFQANFEIQVDGNVNAGANSSGNGIFFGPASTITGDLILAGTIMAANAPTVNGTTTENGSPAAPVPYEAVTVPGATPFSAGGMDINTGNSQTTSLAPGSYGIINLGGGNILELTAPGEYFFESWTAQVGLDLKMDLDAGAYTIFVVGGVLLQGAVEIFDLSSNTQLDPLDPVDAALAANLIVEVGSNFSLNINSDWFGTVFAPNGIIKFFGGSALAGALYAGNESGNPLLGVVDLGVNMLMIRVPAAFRTLTVLKSLVPTNDPGQFVMNANGTDGTPGGNGAIASASVAVGATANFSETGSGGTNLGDYTTTWECTDGSSGSTTSDSLTMPDENVTCTFTNERNVVTDPILTVIKSLDPTSDPGDFIMNANGTPGMPGGDGATASASVTQGALATFSESADTGTDLANYMITWACTGGLSGTGPSDSLTMPATDVTCTFTNVRRTRTLTVDKSLDPTIDPGLFVMNANGTDGTPGGNGATASATVDVGATVTFSEAAGTGTALANYTTSWLCTDGSSGTTTSDSLTMPDADVTCTFTNVRRTRTLTVDKTLVPTNDPGLFVMNANGTDGTPGGNGATASETVDVGATVTFSETGSGGTNLGDYTTTWECTDGSSGSTTSDSLTMPDANVTCTFTNINNVSPGPILMVVKDLMPANDPGLFVMNANGIDGTPGGNGANASASVSAGALVTFSETGSGGTNLGDYTTNWSCTDGSTGSGASGSLTMPGNNVTCTFTNINNAVAPIPTLGEWGLMLLAGLLGLFVAMPGLRRS